MRLIDADSGLPVTFSNSNGITFGSSDPPVVTASISLAAFGVSALADTLNSATSGTIIFSNSNNVTFGMSGSSIITASMGAVALIAAGSQTASTGTLVFSNSNNVTFGFDAGAQTITASASVPTPTMVIWANQNQGDQIFGILTTNGVFTCYPLVRNGVFPGNMTINTLLLAMADNNGDQIANSGFFKVSLGIYTLNGSTLSLLNSASTQIFWGAGGASTAYSGTRWLSFHSSLWSVEPVLSQTMYWFAINVQSSQATQNFSFLGGGVQEAYPIGWGTYGVNATAGNTLQLIYPFLGFTAGSTAALPTSIGSNVLVGNNGNAMGMPYMVFNNLAVSW